MEVHYDDEIREYRDEYGNVVFFDLEAQTYFPYYNFQVVNPSSWWNYWGIIRTWFGK